MYRVALRLLGDEDKASDAVQEACVKALGRLAGFDGRSSMATWLHRITVNCATDARRAKQRQDKVYEALQGGLACAKPPVSPATEAQNKELSDRAWELLERLPESYRSAFALTQLDGYSYDEAASIEEQPRGTIASRVHAAKKILLEQMGDPAGWRTNP